MKKAILGLAVVAALLSTQESKALSFTFDTPYLGSDPSGSITATFTDAGAGVVDLSISGALFGTETLETLYFNLNPGMDPGPLTFTKTSDNLAPTATDPQIGHNSPGQFYAAQNDGRYDIRILFDNSPASDRFDGTDYITYSITSSQAGLDAEDFNFLSDPGSGPSGPFYGVAVVSRVGGESGSSGWLAANASGSAVPDGGATLMMLGAALASLAAAKRFLIG